MHFYRLKCPHPLESQNPRNSLVIEADINCHSIGLANNGLYIKECLQYTKLNLVYHTLDISIFIHKGTCDSLQYFSSLARLKKVIKCISKVAKFLLCDHKIN